MLKTLAFITVVAIGAGFGAATSLILPPPISHIVALVGGAAIGFYGFRLATKLIDQHA